MAIATLEGSFTVYALTSMDEIKEHVEVAGRMLGDNFMPVKEVSASHFTRFDRE